MKKLAPPRGMHDILPADTNKWRKLEGVVAGIFGRYGYRQLRTPVLEYEELFSRPVGEHSDIVQKELFRFEGRGDKSLCMRPEGTVPVARVLAGNDMLRGRTQRVWYMGPMFRHERPQKGRLRQFHQFGAEVMGDGSATSDIEVLALCARMWRELGIEDKLELRINNLGDAKERGSFRAALKEHLSANRDALSETDRGRLEHNPLRVLDTKDEDVLGLIAKGPTLDEFMGSASRTHFDEVLSVLEKIGVSHVRDGLLVRGLDYYNLTVFEWQVKGADQRQNTICGGGRYDGLLEMIGASPTPGTGMAAGMERILELMPDVTEGQGPDLFVGCVGDAHDPARLTHVAESLRDGGLSVVAAYRGGKIRTLMKQADASGAKHLGVIGKRELDEGTITIRPLGNSFEGQVTVPLAACAQHLRKLLGEG